jgi:hypothetical protein
LFFFIKINIYYLFIYKDPSLTNTTKVVIINEDTPSFIDYLMNKPTALKKAEELTDLQKCDFSFKFKKLQQQGDKILNLFECSEVFIF